MQKATDNEQKPRAMKRIILICSLLLAGLNLSAQSRYVMLEGLVETPAGLTYNLPQSTLCIDLEVESEQIIAGPYARYALKCLGVRAPFADKTTYTLRAARIALAAQEELCSGAAPSAPSCGAEEPFPALLIDRIDLLQPTDEEAAMQAAKRIFQLRRTRLELISGEVGEHVFGEGLKSALEEIDRQEQALLELFLGKRRCSVEHHRLTLTPQANKKQYILGRFSESEGLLAATDLSGEIILLDIIPGEPYPVQPAPEKSTTVVACRVAAPSLCSVQLSGSELTSCTLPLFEFGRTVQLLLPRKR